MTCHTRLRTTVLPSAVVIGSVLLLATALIAVGQTTSVKSGALTNEAVLAMVQAGLSEEIVVAKIRNSPVLFDVSTERLIELKQAGVPEPVLTLMVTEQGTRGAVEPTPGSTGAASQQSGTKTLGSVDVVHIKAPSGVLVETAAEVLAKKKGPATNTTGVSYDAELVVSIDCGPQRFSLYTFANYSTCESSMMLISEGVRLWGSTDRERAANGPKAARIMVENMTEDFVKAWRDARKGE